MKRYLLLILSLTLVASCTTPAQNTNTTTTSGETNTVSSGTNEQNAGTSVTQKTIPTPSYGSGTRVLSIFADFQCPACQAAERSLMPIFEEYATNGKLTIEYHQYPLTQIHRNAMGDALAALCAADQGKYMEYKKELYAMEEKKSRMNVTDQERIALAANVGLDTDAFTSCLTNKVFEGQVKADMALGDSLGVPGTPTFFLDGKRLDMSNFTDVATLRTFLDSVLVTQ